MSGVSILMYHQIGRFCGIQGHRANFCDYRRYQRQMAYLHYLQYRVLSMEEILACLNGEMSIPTRGVALTFDDGYENFYEYAFPVLRKYRFSATVYVIADMISKVADWMRPISLSEPPRLMSVQQLRDIGSQGIEIGSHAFSHAKLAELAPQEQQREIQQSKQRLEQLLDREIRHFCYPYGSFNEDSIELTRRAGYRSAVTCLRGGVSIADDPLVLPRKAISFGDTLPGYIWKLEMKNAPKPELEQWRKQGGVRGRRGAEKSLGG